MMDWDSVTIWREVSKGIYTHKFVVGCRVEETRAQQDGTVSPVPAWSLRAFFFTDEDIDEGDYIAIGIHDEDIPTFHAHLVQEVTYYVIRGYAHHVEVKA